ncbi:hypothetical protein [uncultured Clostridium sp.]|uniref:hypothetical protein n=1 Tax=uncultured Clostridium sp. TaxID=59620 RepID=UPI0026009B55|nr:hypothetical protein [uncultured Clostridium sp.]
MKKIICLLLIATTTLISGCSNKEEKSKPSKEGEAITTNKEVEKNDIKESDSVLDDDLYSFELLINGEKYKLPCDYEELSKRGWNIENDMNEVLAPNEYSMSTDMINGDCTFSARFLNLGVNEVPYNKCKLGGLIISDTDVKNGTDVKLPKGINMKSSKDDIIKAYGEPTRNSESGDLAFLSYELGLYQEIEFTIDEKSNEVIKLKMDNMIEEKNDTNKESSTSTEEQKSSDENVSKSATELGDDLFNKNVEVEGVVYTLPASIKEFEQNGWKVQEEAGEKVKARDTNVRVTLRKNNSVIKVSAKNNTANETEVENCDITRIEVREENKISLKLPKGVQIGSSKEELESAYTGLETKKSDSTNFEYYNYLKDGLSINISVSKDTMKITTIEVYYMK